MLLFFGQSQCFVETHADVRREVTDSVSSCDQITQDACLDQFGCKLTLSLHPHLKAFPQPTELAAIAVVFVDDAVLFTAAAVGQVLPHTPLEEAFASLTTDRSVVTP